MVLRDLVQSSKVSAEVKPLLDTTIAQKHHNGIAFDEWGNDSWPGQSNGNVFRWCVLETGECVGLDEGDHRNGPIWIKAYEAVSGPLLCLAGKLHKVYAEETPENKARMDQKRDSSLHFAHGTIVRIHVVEPVIPWRKYDQP